ncbi:hypothetical protein CYMTET_41123 [Cymbomonas tetramitiformis]|uniref:Uncharacterized protein n=1 Tax=Cymbomonas tetramitiformis TaxID=36881 RepID=A0AAE0C8R2_9CHLO|nr:hypothetical protein CYMTET_41123 [Cymbomonas tetramitiformis]
MLRICYFLIGLSAWLVVCAIYAEAGYFVDRIPESYAIYCQIDFAVQLGNVAPLLLVLLFPHWIEHNCCTIVYTILVLSLITSFGLSTLWNITLENRSVVILGGSFLAGVVGATSMATLFAIARRDARSQVSIKWLSTGLGCSGLVANLLALAQGLALQRARLIFSTQTYFVTIGTVQCIALAASKAIVRSLSASANTKQLPLRIDELNTRSEESEAGEAIESEDLSLLPCGTRVECHDSLCWTSKLAKLRRHALPLVAIFATNFLQFGAPGLLPFLLPGTERNSRPCLFWLNAGFQCSDVVGRLATSLSTSCTSSSRRGKQLLTFLSVAHAIPFVYMVCVAHIGGQGGHIPSIYVSLVFVVAFSFCHGYISTVSFQSLAEDHAVTIWGGLLNQFGALFGSVLTFILVNTHVIKKA